MLSRSPEKPLSFRKPRFGERTYVKPKSKPGPSKKRKPTGVQRMNNSVPGLGK